MRPTVTRATIATEPITTPEIQTREWLEEDSDGMREIDGVEETAAVAGFEGRDEGMFEVVPSIVAAAVTDVAGMLDSMIDEDVIREFWITKALSTTKACVSKLPVFVLLLR
jgi:hypothetical protein